MTKDPDLIHLDDYEQYIGSEAVDRITRKAKALGDHRVVNVNSTYYGGGVAEILDSLTLLMNGLGIETQWSLIKGEPDFFGITKKMHNALQGAELEITEREWGIYESVIRKNAIRMNLHRYDTVVIHDPQPLCLIQHFHKRCPWVWRCHIDLSSPNPSLWQRMLPMLRKFDAMIVSSEDFRRHAGVPELIFMPAIDPFSIRNRPMSQQEAEERLELYGIPLDLPLVVQVSRFDRWKDPKGVVEAFKIARREVDATLVLLGNIATDDPEGPEVYQSLLDEQGERIILISRDDTALVNALQQRAAVVVQKSLREGFGLTVAEAMWKGTPVIGGNVGGIRLQIQDGENGFLVSSIEETADRMVALLNDESLRMRMGEIARESVRRQFLLSRLLEQYLDLIGAFEVRFYLRLSDE